MERKIINQINKDIKEHLKENPLEDREFIGIFSEGTEAIKLNAEISGCELLTALFVSKSQTSKCQEVNLIIHNNVQLENPVDYEIILKQFKKQIKRLEEENAKKNK